MQIQWKLFKKEVPVHTQKTENLSEYEESEEQFPCISWEKVYDDIEDLLDHNGDMATNSPDPSWIWLWSAEEYLLYLITLFSITWPRIGINICIEASLNKGNSNWSWFKNSSEIYDWIF